jgi:hypothetical protein
MSERESEEKPISVSAEIEPRDSPPTLVQAQLFCPPFSQKVGEPAESAVDINLRCSLWTNKMVELKI